MTASLDQCPVLVVVYAMHECPACEHYLPRLLSEVAALQAQGYPFIVYEAGTALSPNAIPVLVFDAATEDGNVQRFADRFGVTATPTTIIALRNGGGAKYEGALANNQILQVLMMANEEANR